MISRTKLIAGIPYVILIGDDEIISEKYTLKNMTSGEQSKLSIQEILSHFETNK